MKELWILQVDTYVHAMLQTKLQCFEYISQTTNTIELKLVPLETRHTELSNESWTDQNEAQTREIWPSKVDSQIRKLQNTQQRAYSSKELTYSSKGLPEELQTFHNSSLLEYRHPYSSKGVPESKNLQDWVAYSSIDLLTRVKVIQRGFKLFKLSQYSSKESSTRL